MKEFLSCGEFAKKCKIPKKTIIYYNDIGLIKPAKVEKNGYRYYTLRQITTVSTIKALQAIGMSLAEIKEVIDNTEIDKSKEIMLKQEKLLEEKINQLLNYRGIIRETFKNLDLIHEKGLENLFFDEINELPIITTAFTVRSAVIHLDGRGIITGGRYDENFCSGDTPVDLFNVYYNNGQDIIHDDVIQGGKYICGYFSNFYVSKSVEKFKKMCDEKCIKTSGYIYFIDASNDLIHTEEKNDIHKIMAKVRTTPL